MAVTPLPIPDDHTAPTTTEAKKTPDLALVTNTPAGSENKPQGGEAYGAVTRPRLAAVRDAGEDAVPATARYSGELTAGALALRHQAIIRLGVASSPHDEVREDLPGLPDARLWGGRLAQAVSEVLAGDRPISQLVRFTDDQVFLELNRRVRLLGLNSTAGTRGAKEKSTLRSVRVFMPNPAIAEVAAHVRHGDRSRAVALRLEIRRNRWVCTALELD